MDHKGLYTAFCANDSRFDGRFFVGVSSTGIYCRPVCRVKTPKAENCTFFTSAAAAEAAGYRPCLKCRPELAPGLAPVDSAVRLAQSAARIVEEDGLADCSIPDLAARLGVSDRHLRRVFFKEYGVSLVQYIQTWRLLLAKRLLTDTQLSMTEIAMIAGFGSIRRFNDLFRKHYRLAPSKLRRAAKKDPDGKDGVTLSVSYRPPYAWDQLLAFLAARAIPGVESVTGNVYRRTAAIAKGETVYSGWVAVTDMPRKNSLAVTLAPSLLPVLPQLLTKIRCLFDTNCNPAEIYAKLSVMNTLAPDLCVPGIRLPGCFDPFELSVRAILGQQVTVKAAATLAGRLAAAFGARLSTPFEELSFVFPGAEQIYALTSPIENHLGPLGITKARARSILALAEALLTGAITLNHSTDPAKAMEKLLQLPGFGPWTVQYIGMRALGWPDAFPHTDLGIKKALPDLTPKEILTLSQAWSPWRSYAAITLWNSLSKYT